MTSNNNLGLNVLITGKLDSSVSQAVQQARSQLEQLSSTSSIIRASQANSIGDSLLRANLVTDLIEGSAQTVLNIFSAIEGAAASLTEHIFTVVNNMQLAKEQLEILLSNSTKLVSDYQTASADAIEYARRTALEAPFVKFQDSVTAIRQLTAAGLDYTRWLKIVQDTSAATTANVEEMGDRIRSVTHSLSNIAAGATGIGLRGLRQAGINVREAGIEFEKSGQAIGSTEEILRKLEVYLTEKFGGSLEKLNRTFPAIKQNVEDLFAQLTEATFTPIFQPLFDRMAEGFDNLVLKEDEFGINGAEKMRAFFSVLGDMAGSGFNQILGIFDEGWRQLVGPNPQQTMAEGGANIILAFVDGMLSAAIFVLQAVAEIANIVAGFLVGFSPPKEGPLSTIDEGGQNVIGAWSEGLSEGGAKAEKAATGIAARVSTALARAGSLGPSLREAFGGSSDVSDLLNRAVPSFSVAGIKTKGANAAASFLEGFRTGFDLSPIKDILSALESLLKYGVDTKQLAESAYAPYLEGLTELLYRAALEVQEFGAVTQATLAQVDASFGMLASTVENILNLMGALAQIGEAIDAAQAEVDAAQAGVDAAQAAVDAYDKAIKAAERNVKAKKAQVDAAQDIVKSIDERIAALQLQIKQFELQTSEIPDRFLRGRKREFDATQLRLEQEKRLAELQVEAAQKKVDAAQKEVEKLRELQDLARERVDDARKVLKAAQDHLKELQKQKQAVQDLLKMEEQKLKLLQEQLKAEDEAAKKKKAAGAGDVRGFSDPFVGLGATGLAKQFDDLKAKTKDWLETLNPERMASIRAKFEELKKTLRGFFDPEAGTDTPGGKFQKAFGKINDFIKETIKIVTSGKEPLEIFFDLLRTGGGKTDPDTELKIERVRGFIAWVTETAIPTLRTFISETLPRFLNEIFTISLPDLMKKVQIPFKFLQEFWDIVLPGLGTRFENFIVGLKTAVDNFGQEWYQKWVLFKLWALEKWQEFSDGLWNKWVEIVRFVNEKIDAVLEAIGRWVTDGWTALTTWFNDVLTKAGEWKDSVVAKINELKDEAVRKFGELRDEATRVVEDAKTAITSKFEEARSTASQAISDLRDAIVNAFQNTNWDDVFSGILGVIEKIRKAIADTIGKLQDLLKQKNNSDTSGNTSGAGGNGASGFDSGNASSQGQGSTNTTTAGEYQMGGVVFKTANYLLHAGEVVLNGRQQANVLAQMGVAGAASNMQPVSIQFTNVWEVVPDLNDRLDLENRMEKAALNAFNQAITGRKVRR